ncbi:hypothetical protein DXG03_006158 [Asterophora parasitica]|uniref:Transmembrane protein n=1 Tax=Asterophora parasitica TaxID=117018 RepID=A0A9P7GDT4_9AGAR|nr:hypothetical protein DXG03_006158 [Asterophora parasitica]
MDIDFKPALNDIAHVLAPLTPRGLATAVLNFSATLNVAGYEELERGGGKIQLWTNIPSGGVTTSTNGGDWNSCDFQDTASAAGPRHSTTELLLGDLAQYGGDPPGSTLLSLQVSVPLSNNGQSRFAFTYRIIYPSGEIRWLGAFGQNGTLLVEGVKSEPAFVLASGWTSRENVYVFKGVGAEKTTVITLAKPAEYDVWTLDGYATSKKSSLIVFLVPRPAPRSVYTSPTYVICASADARFMVSDGIITASGTGTLLLQPLQSDRQGLDAIMENILVHCSPERVQVIAQDAGQLLIASKGISPIQGIVATSPRLLPLATFSALFPAQTPFTLFSPQNHTAHFFPHPSTAQKQSIAVTSSGPFILSATLSLNAGDSEYQVSVLTPYKSALAASDADDSLVFPTPPPSPHLRPVAHLSSAATASSMLSLRSGISGARSAQGQPATSPNTNKEQGSQHDRNDANALIERPRDAIQALLAQLWFISAAFFVIVTVFRLFFGKLPKHEEESVDDADEVDARSVRALDEKEPEANDDIWVGAQPPALDLPSSSFAETPGVSLASTSLVVDVSGGTVVLALRAVSPSVNLGTGGGAAIQLTVEMGGKDVHVKEMPVGGGVSLFEFDGGEGGSARVRIVPAI